MYINIYLNKHLKLWQIYSYCQFNTAVFHLNLIYSLVFSIRSYKQVFDLKQDYFSSLRLRAAINITLSGNTNEVVIPLSRVIKIRKNH